MVLAAAEDISLPYSPPPKIRRRHRVPLLRRASRAPAAATRNLSTSSRNILFDFLAVAVAISLSCCRPTLTCDLRGRRCSVAFLIEGLRVQYGTVLYRTVLHCTVPYCTLPYCTVRYCIVILTVRYGIKNIIPYVYTIQYIMYGTGT